MTSFYHIILILLWESEQNKDFRSSFLDPKSFKPSEKECRMQCQRKGKRATSWDV